MILVEKAQPIQFEPSIRVQTVADAPALAALHDASFGPGRYARTAYRIRERGVSDPRLNLCIAAADRLIGAVHLTPITVGDVPGALLLGPLVIADDYKNQGYGLKLMQEGLSRARQVGYDLVVLVGDLPYYARAGFAVAPQGQFVMPGPVDPRRFLFVELVVGAITKYKGDIKGMLALP